MDYSKFRDSLARLEAQERNYSNESASRSQLDQEGVAESVIQRFETCYDCLWKALRRHLNEKLGLADTPSSPKPILRLAHENHLLPSPIEQWLAYANARTDTAHEYDSEKAQSCLDLIPDFIADATRLYETLSGGRDEQ